jgi:biopolymer transport protein ExbD
MQPQVARLNLVSLMDIFTILVFFLLLNSSDVPVLQATESIRLPDSVASGKPIMTLTIGIDADAIFVAGERVMSVAEATAQDGAHLPALAMALNAQVPVLQASSAVNQTTMAPVTMAPITRAPITRATKVTMVTIMGDRSTDYGLLKKVISTCAESGFGQVSLAVNQVSGVAMDSQSLAAGAR